MNRPAPYADATVNRYAAASQLLQMSAQRMQQNAQINDFPPTIELNPMSPPSFSQGVLFLKPFPCSVGPLADDILQLYNYMLSFCNCWCEPGYKGNVFQSLSQERLANQKISHENQASNDPRLQSYEQDMEIGYEDNKPSEITFAGLEQKFQDEIMKLIKELSDVEDEENARHKERMVEINTRYQENLSSLRVQHAARIGEFLRKESEARLHQYQQAAIRTHLTERGQTDPRYYAGPRPYGIMQNNSYIEHPQYHGHGGKRGEGPEVRVPYPHGRVCDNSGSHY